MKIQKNEFNKNMLPYLDENQDSLAKEFAEMEINISDEIELIVDDIVNQILLINQHSKQSNEDLISNKLSGEDEIDEIIDVVGEWTVDEELTQSLLNYETDCISKDDIKLNNNNKCRPFTEASPQKEIEKSQINSPNKQFKTVQRQKILPEYFIVQKTSKDIFQKVSTEIKTDTLKRDNSYEFSINPRVVLERLSISSVKPKIQIELTDTKNKASTTKIVTGKAVYCCSDCHFKTYKRKKMIFHLDESSHSSVHYKNQVISNGNFYSMKQRQIHKECKAESKNRYQLRNKYSNKCYSCSYNKCHFTAKNWKLMYNHVKFNHNQLYKSKRNQGKHRNQYIFKDVSRNSKLAMRAVVIIERLPTHVLNSNVPIQMKQWLPYASSIMLKKKVQESIFGSAKKAEKFLYLSVNHKRKIISDTNKYKCAFNKCMFFTTDWKIMHRHVKLCHVHTVT